MKYFKKWEDLTITDDFMFCKVMQDENICRELLELILHVKIGKITFLTSQHEIEADLQSKAVTMDVYLRDENKVINVEMQTGHRLELPKRARYYQAVADTDNTPPGIHYSSMKDNYVIFICTFDPFRLGRAMYMFENICIDSVPPLPLDDGTHKLFLNTAAGDLTRLDPGLKLFYDYIHSGRADSRLTEQINGAIKMIKQNREARRKYMTYTTRIMEAKTEALNEGIAIGISQGEHKKALETAKSMKHENMPIPIIAHFTGLSAEEIDKL